MKTPLPVKKLLAFASCALALSLSVSATTGYLTNFGKAAKEAQTEKKMLFIIYGREGCEYCAATKAMIKAHQIDVTADKYVKVELNCDDPKVAADFEKRYGLEVFGEVLPYVVVADSNGRALARSGGPKDAGKWAKILQAAQRKAAVAR